MFVIIARKIDNDGNPGEPMPVTEGFQERTDAMGYLQELFARYPDRNGYVEEQGYWWVSDDAFVTRYTIESDDDIAVRPKSP